MRILSRVRVSLMMQCLGDAITVRFINLKIFVFILGCWMFDLNRHSCIQFHHNSS